jgi:hypothetical protein
MVERPKPTATRPPSGAAGVGGRGGGAKHDAFDVWLRGALRQLFGAVADEPVPEALRRLATGEAPPASGEGAAGADPSRQRDPPGA